MDLSLWYLMFLNYFTAFNQHTNIDTLLVATDQTERIVEPPENVQEKIAFIFNNLSQSNMSQKVFVLTICIFKLYIIRLSFYLLNHLLLCF